MRTFLPHIGRMSEDPHFDKDSLLFSPRFGDHYFSRHDGRAECAHVFVAGNGLPQRWEGQKEFTVGELGFGTGLNFLETWRTWMQFRHPNQHLNFISVEGYFLEKDKAQQALSAWPDMADQTQHLLDQWDHLHQPTSIDDQTNLQVLQGDVATILPDFPMVDAWYLDGFAPARNPDMWSAELMQELFNKTSSGGTFASYTAAGWVRRNLQDAGFDVEKRTGFGTKRDMIGGIKP